MDTPSIQRHRTAIRRLGHSRPVALAQAQGLIAPDVSFFDYGCGFQKIYTQTEFRQYLQAILGGKPYMASLGIAYVFKDEAVESAQLAQLSITPLKRERADLFFATKPR
jgi:hypothetical protein